MFQENVAHVKQSQILFETLASKIYQNPTVSSYREILANALDIHRQVGQKKKPVLSLIPAIGAVPFCNDAIYVSIRDYGTGISKEDFPSVYMTFFETTKTEADSGAYGLGAKTPFGICYKYLEQSNSTNTKLSFYVNSFQNGVVTQYINYLSDDGIPVFSIVGEFETDEPDGLEVKFLHLEGYNPFHDLMFVVSFIDRIDVSIDESVVDFKEAYDTAVNGIVRKRVNANTDIVNVFDINSLLYREAIGQAGYGRWNYTSLMFRKGDIVYKLKNSSDVVNTTIPVKQPVGVVIYVVDVNAIEDFEYTIPSSRESIDFSCSNTISEYISNAVHSIINKESFIDTLMSDFATKMEDTTSIGERLKIVNDSKTLFRNESILRYIRENNIKVTDILVRQKSNLEIPECELGSFTVSFPNRPAITTGRLSLAIDEALKYYKIDDVLFLIRDKKQYKYIHQIVTNKAVVLLDDSSSVHSWLKQHNFEVEKLSDYSKPKTVRKKNRVSGDLPRLRDRFNSNVKLTQVEIERYYENGVPVVLIDGKIKSNYRYTYNGETYSVKYSDGDLLLTSDCGHTTRVELFDKGKFFSTMHSTSRLTLKKAEDYIKSGYIITMDDWLKNELPKYTVTLSADASLNYFIRKSNNILLRVLFNSVHSTKYRSSKEEERNYEDFARNDSSFNPRTYFVIKDSTEFNRHESLMRQALEEDPVLNELCLMLTLNSVDKYPHVVNLIREKLSEKFDTTRLYDMINSMY